jgi:GH15 family glucan-1,4-alpha-glucosidase
MNLLDNSIQIILKNQSDYGSFAASPSFETYNFCWLRDGSFIAFAMDKCGEYGAAGKFYGWVDTVIKRYGFKVEKIVNKIDKGVKIEKSDFLNARFTLDGYEEKEDGWGNFQLDAYGTWLWCLAQHIEETKETYLINEYAQSISLTVKYIENLWNYPDYDIWEENSNGIHTSTLACLFGGLNSINKYIGDSSISQLAKRIRTFILSNCVIEDTFAKYIGTNEVDSSLIWMAVPFNVVTIDNPIFLNTVKRIEKELLHNGGVHRYKADTYYGGGEWILLSCWLGWFYTITGQMLKAEEIINWVESTADENNYLPEQVCTHVNDELYYPYWVNKWGVVASPLLWSHAMYIILKNKIHKGVNL